MIDRTDLTDADRAYHRIKDMIITLKLDPGDVIKETELQPMLGLGRTPIREALKRLEAENLVIIKPRRGIFVADIAITDLTQIYEVRIELEVLAARLAAQRMSPAKLATLRDLAEEYCRMDRSDLPALFVIDRKFHIGLAETAGNAFLCRELELFYNLSLRIWYLALDRISAEDIDVDAHLEILTAVEAKDLDTVEERMREHIGHFHRVIRHHF